MKRATSNRSQYDQVQCPPVWVIRDWIESAASLAMSVIARKQGAWANIPPKRNRKDPICFSPYLYRARNLIERFFNKIKQCRRVATRYDKLAANYLAFVKLASIRIWLRANESTP
jgi:transposase